MLSPFLFHLASPMTFPDYLSRECAQAAYERWGERTRDPRPVLGETLQEHIDRMVLGRPDGRHWVYWGWPSRPPGVYFEASYVWRPAERIQMNHLFQSVGSDVKFSGL